MTVNVEALINSLGTSYKDMLNAGLINYKTEPKGHSGSENLSLRMEKEGVFLSFKREGRILSQMTLTIQHDTLKNWEFPNELPTPLQKSMSRHWVHEHVGNPLRSAPPKVIMKRSFGWTDLYEYRGRGIPTSISMQISYDVADNVRSVTFMPTSELCW